MFNLKTFTMKDIYCKFMNKFDQQEIKQPVNTVNAVNTAGTVDTVSTAGTAGTASTAGTATNSQLDQQKTENQQKIEKVRALCVAYSNAKHLSCADITKLMMHMIMVRKMDPQNVSQNLNFVKIVYNPNNQLTNVPMFLNPTDDYNKLEQIIKELVQTKKSQYAICYWDGIRYKDGISFQIYGTHNVPNCVSPARCYDEIIKEFKLQNGQTLKVKSYELLL
jgi:hypothetical protein